MANLFILCLLASPFVLVAGLVKPSLFTKLFGKVPTRMAIAKISGGIFLGSFFGAAFTLPPVEHTEEIQTVDSDVVLSKELQEGTAEPQEEVPLQAQEPETETKQEDSEPEITVEESAIEATDSSAQNSAPAYTPEPVYESEPTPEPTPVPSTPSYNCSSNSYNCGDFSNWPAAQDVYQYCLDTVGWDIHGLDRDDDGSACDDLKE